MILTFFPTHSPGARHCVPRAYLHNSLWCLKIVEVEDVPWVDGKCTAFGGRWGILPLLRPKYYRRSRLWPDIFGMKLDLQDYTIVIPGVEPPLPISACFIRQRKDQFPGTLALTVGECKSAILSAVTIATEG